MLRTLLLLCLLGRAEAANLTLLMETGEPFDGACNALKQHDDYKITKAMREELTRRIPEFTKLWNDQGSSLVVAMAELVGRPYARKEETLTLTLCQWFSPMSAPLILRAREYLKATAVDNPKGPEAKPPAYFVAQVFHELIHRYLDQHFPNIDSSPLAKAHSTEPPGVISHLHHLSILKAVYLKSNRKAELATVIELDSRIPSGIYKRAWEIVNAEGHEKYLAELR